MTQMTPRERVVAALSHQEPDRVPLDIGSGASNSIVVEGYENLKAAWGIDGETATLSKAFRVARLDERVLRKLGSDTRPLAMRAPLNWSPPASSPGEFMDVWGVTWRQAFYGEGCYYYELARHPLQDASIADLDRYPWPDPLDPGLVAGLADEAKGLFEGTLPLGRFAIVADSGFKGFFERAYWMRGLEQMMVDLASNHAFVQALMEKMLEINLVGTRRFLEIVGPYIQVFRAGDDLATQRGSLMSPRTFRQVLKPYYKRFFDFVHSMTEARIFFHSCGDVRPLLDDLIEIGVDAINPVQVSAMGDTRELKARFGDRITFWGAIDTQRVLPFGTVEDVRDEVRRRIRDLGPGGGFVAGAVHNIQPDVPVRNIEAMAESVREFGRYPLS